MDKGRGVVDVTFKCSVVELTHSTATPRAQHNTRQSASIVCCIVRVCCACVNRHKRRAYLKVLWKVLRAVGLRYKLGYCVVKLTHIDAATYHKGHEINMV